ncbi:MAG: Abi family protein [Leuconostoc mesenteroides]
MLNNPTPKYDKPFKSLSDQLKLLKLDRNLDLEDNEPEIALYLLNNGYYNIINGYGEQYEDPNQPGKKYKESTTFSDIYKLYIADQIIARSIFPDLLKVEKTLDTLLGYYVAEAFGVNNFSADDPKNPWPTDKSYLDKENYNLSNFPYSSVTKLYDVIEEAKGTPLAYYRDHKNHIPPWILFDSTEFGTINRYFKVLPPKIKLKITNQLLPPTLQNIAPDGLIMKSMFNYFEVIRQFRNQFAHNSRFSFSSFPDCSIGKKFREHFAADFLFTDAEYKSGNGKGDLYNLFIVLILFAKTFQQAEAQIEYYKETIFYQFKTISASGAMVNDEKALRSFLIASKLPTDFDVRLLKFAKLIYTQ